MELWTALRAVWQEAHDTRASPTALGIYYVDLAISPDQRAPVVFTFYWPGENRWEGRDYRVTVEPRR